MVRRLRSPLGAVRGNLRRRRLRPRAAGTGACCRPMVRPGRQHPHGPRWQDAAGAGEPSVELLIKWTYWFSSLL